jgi:hypothetical protein
MSPVIDGTPSCSSYWVLIHLYSVFPANNSSLLSAALALFLATTDAVSEVALRHRLRSCWVDYRIDQPADHSKRIEYHPE